MPESDIVLWIKRDVNIQELLYPDVVQLQGPKETGVITMRTTPSFIEQLRSRRSIRKFKPEKLSQTVLEQLQEALLRAPTSRGKNPWNFLFIDDQNLLEKISCAKLHGSAFLAGAALGVVICADESVSDVWVEDASIAAITLQYAAHDIGLGSCWAQIRNRPHDQESTAEKYIQTLLKLDDNRRILCIIGIGVPDEEKAGHAESELQSEKIIRIDAV